MATLATSLIGPTNQTMYIAKSRVVADKDGNIVKDGDPKADHVVAGFKGAVISEKEMAKLKGAEAFFEADNLTKGKSAPSKRVLAEPESVHTKGPAIKGKSER